jgi:formylglycine-generating enzyme
MALVDGRFCMDKWEASTFNADRSEHSPFLMIGNARVFAVSREDVVPQAHASAEDAERACKHAGKQLCTSQQWHDACKGSRAPYRVFPYGMTERKAACNIHRPAHPTFLVFGTQLADVVSLNDPRLNQQPNTVARTGEFSDCVTPEGIHDLHGNLLEWVMGPDRPLLLGGHYVDGKLHGPGCHYVTAGHDSKYADYTTGFRCCAPRGRPAADAGAPDGEPEAVAVPEVASGDAAPPPPPAVDVPRDPPGMRGFYDSSGTLPKLSPPAYEPADARCPVDMAFVEGVRCSIPFQKCLRWLPRLSVGKQIACAEFESPSICTGDHRSMRFCIDRYEFTPPEYALPLTHVNYAEAANLCNAMNKRLCYEEEWEFACEGPEALPFPYGFVRDPKRCNHDFPEQQLVTTQDHFVDHRVKADSLPGCKSPFGVYNMVGNVDEWTTRLNEDLGHRGVLRGGWWLIGRNRCRAATTNHGETYAGMQTGFRCCKGARP